MATSYTNLGGSGDRVGVVGLMIEPATLITADPLNTLDGSNDNEVYFGSATISSAYWLFDFGNAVVIDEAKFYQDIADSNGVWKWQGSNDNSSFTDIGSSFTLGTSATHTITQLNGNTTAYRYYRLQGVSGSLSGASWVRQWEFKIDGMTDPTPGTSYANTGGTGDRRGIITMSDSGIIAGTSPYNNWIDGSTTENNDYFTGGALSSSVYVRWDFGAGNSKVINQAKFYHSDSSKHGFWKWQGSNDASAWTDIGHRFELGALTPQFITALGGNSTGYRYYQIVGVSGSSSGTPWVREFEFKIGDPAGGAAFSQTLTGSMTPSGTLRSSAVKILASTITAVGVVRRAGSKTLSGGVTASGTLRKDASKRLIGATTPSGTLRSSVVKILASTITAVGVVRKAGSKTLSGGITLSGLATSFRVILQTLTGSATSAGSVRKDASKRLTGSSTPSGTLRSSVVKILASAITAVGAVRKAASKTVLGQIASSGTLASTRFVSRVLSGEITPTGFVRKAASRLFTGATAASGLVRRNALKTFIGTIAATGNLINQFIGTVAEVLLKGLGFESSILTLNLSESAAPYNATTSEAGVDSMLTSEELA